MFTSCRTTPATPVAGERAIEPILLVLLDSLRLGDVRAVDIEPRYVLPCFAQMGLAESTA